ncbi:D-ribose pyranase [Bacillus paranthracis]|uniref:D-ribose pyranase n=1 Tax=Bacillus paranthracis TaxID=2026186 RepID=A0A1J9Y8Q5_9BACI|nr:MULTISPECIES: D-ribose pyranase [Bacillus]ADY19967.1 D-ribose pyranase [Bacillus thuringiensis serovar finitimus YBT-020]ASZ15773.1 D-ribose pyranase [Bacillus cereus]EJP97864.1 D-ribose pyranase [Bacillus cereus AND1407]EJR11633.1 D-ribose pyranase [Bacillus cereus MSX-D12]EJR46712.1 D-ribose pyranase [Bacillus cereus VD102]MCW4576786.1 D-ribose pyranase [Bacillus pacificus]MRA61974.1 D-ribose pyranase [Bacillus thuringiensis]OTX76944.1 D-ribose pyranase [Bacillus thuringiensis serovar 
MKKHGVLNSEIASILASLGHTDTIVIADCGLPIPDGVKRIDLAVEIGKPSFLDVLQVVADDMAIEKVTLAEEVINNNAEINKEIELKLVEPAFEYVSHEQFKEHTKKAKAIIRTGEATPYANVILHAGVIF